MQLVSRRWHPIRKTLVAYLPPLLPTMRDDVYGAATSGGTAARELTLEGMAILDHGHVALVKDDDFGVTASTGAAPPRNWLWMLQVTPLSARATRE